MNVPKSDKSVLLTVDINLSRQKVHTRCAGSEDILGGDGDSDEGQHYNPQIWEQHLLLHSTICRLTSALKLQIANIRHLDKNPGSQDGIMAAWINKCLFECLRSIK